MPTVVSWVSGGISLVGAPKLMRVGAPLLMRVGALQLMRIWGAGLGCGVGTGEGQRTGGADCWGGKPLAAPRGEQRRHDLVCQV